MCRLRRALPLIIICSISTPVFSQSLEEIVVTAQKREQNLQDTALSISAVNAEQMDLLNITDGSRLEILVPGFTWGEGGSNAWPSIRGINTPSQEVNLDPSIAFFTDGIYKSRIRQAKFGFVDMERVEVLRGPQGTLFGRNSTGGAVSMITKKPTDEFEGSIDVTLGSFALTKATGILNVPFSETLQGRFVLDSETMDGYVDNIGPGQDVQDRDSFFGRASLLFTPNDTVEIIARLSTYDSSRVGGGPFAYKRLGVPYIAFDDSTAGRSIAGSPLYVNVRATPSDGIPDFTTPDGTMIDVGRPVNRDPYTIDTDFADSDRSDFTDGSIQATFDLGSTVLTYLGSYSAFNSLPEDDLDKTSTATTGLTTDQSVAFLQDINTSTHEIQLASNTDASWEWVVGAYYLKDDLYENFSVTLENIPLTVVDRRNQVDVDSLSFFGQASWRLTDAFRLTLGGRHSEDEKDFLQTDRCTTCPGGRGITADIDGAKFDRFTWRVAGDYRFNDDMLVYGAVATGFRSGGFTRDVDDPATLRDDSIVESEKNISYEVGMKSELMDNRLRLNVAAYYTEIEDQQVSTVIIIPGTVTGQSSLANAGETSALGLEVELQAALGNDWFVYGTLAFNDAEYDKFFTNGLSGTDGNPDFDDLLDGVLDGGVELAGNKPPRAPEITFAATVGRNIQLASGILTPALTLQYSDEFYNTFYNTSIDRQPSYTKFDARIAYESADGKWGLSAYGQNLSDEAVMSRGTLGARRDYFVAYALPRNYGVKFNLNF